MNKKIELSESLEDYLEIILNLQNAHKVARSKDIAEKMGIKRGSVTGTLKNLAQKGLINYESYGFITLTPEGTKIAKEIKLRHEVIKDFLFRVLQIEDKKADATACRMEHAMDRPTVNMLVKFIDFIDNCPRAGADWMQAFNNFCSTEKPDRKKCKSCLAQCIAQFK
ncbi:MAG: metal-dependent transcriptional regulator [Deltaproteobacteria bacterium]|nr:metal-dependent transcriptional regulator [Deltaproteobacteria bacterium]MBW2220132.1 metal-dependent transcriptional regulator [Deltaproteobacteria bacterium]